MSDLYIALVYAALLFLGLIEPFAFSLGYIWVDFFYPQTLSSVLAGFPVAMVMGSAAIAAYWILDRRAPPRLTLTTVLTIAMAGWVTLTSTWAVAPMMAWAKWDWAFKTILFSAFVPYVFRSRVQIEALIQVFAFSAAVYVIPSGIKTLITGGGYGAATGIVRGNSGLLESSTVSAVAVMLIPLLLMLRKESVLLPWPRLRALLYVGYSMAAFFCAIGSYARTSLIGFGILGLFTWLRSRHKVLTTLSLAFLGLGLFTLGPNGWDKRMDTITTYNRDASALSRILVWQWTLHYVAEHPFGGGFDAYYIDEISLPPLGGNTEPEIAYGKAFHSIYFEVLGEHGWIGLSIFLSLLVSAIRNLQWVIRYSRKQDRAGDEIHWCYDFAGAVLLALLTLIACGAFIGIAFQPMIWYIVATSTCLRQYVERTGLSEPERVRVTVVAKVPREGW